MIFLSLSSVRRFMKIEEIFGFMCTELALYDHKPPHAKEKRTSDGGKKTYTHSFMKKNPKKIQLKDREMKEKKCEKLKQ